jgi:transposase
MTLNHRRRQGDTSPAAAKAASASPVHPDAAGIDIASADCVVAIPPDRDPRPIRTFLLTTDGLHALRDWLLACRIRTVAIEATGNYWIALYDVLDQAGIEVWLCNARHAKGVPGHKTDVQDAEWLRQLHTAGLLRRSYRPDKEIRPLRYLLRHRAGIVQAASQNEQHMQKVLNEINLRLHHVLSDLTGATGTRILEAILAGERDPATLATLKDSRCKAKDHELIAALTGNYQEEYLFVLGQCWQEHRHLQNKMRDVDARLEGLMTPIPAAHEDPPSSPGAPTPQAGENEATTSANGNGPGSRPAPMPKVCPSKAHKKRNPPHAPIWEQAWRVFGVNLSLVPGISGNIVAVLMGEVGGARHLKEHFKSAGHFCSWLGLCPDKRTSGGKTLTSKTRKVSNRLSSVLRMGALAASYSHSALGDFARRMKSRLGKAEGI